jgi:hypothetical protein
VEHSTDRYVSETLSVKGEGFLTEGVSVCCGDACSTSVAITHWSQGFVPVVHQRLSVSFSHFSAHCPTEAWD